MSDKKLAFIFASIVIIMGFLAFGFVSEAIKHMNAVRTEAVERGYAEWVPDKHGNTTFKWKEVAK